MRVRNVHTSSVDGIAPGAEGEVHEGNPGVRAMLGTLLVPVKEAGEAFARVEGRAPTFEDGLAMVAEIARLNTALDAQQAVGAQLLTDLNAARARIAELEASGSKTVRELRAELAAVKADLAQRPPAPQIPTGNG